MRIRYIISIICLLLSASLSAAGEDYVGTKKRLRYGVEWSYIMTLQSGYHHNYFSTEGFRVDVRGNDFLYYSNGEVLLHAGYDIRNNWNISLYMGYAGVHDIHSTIPVSIRATRYSDSNIHGDKWFGFTDLGSGICLKREPQEILTGKIGGGYSLALSPTTMLDLILAARITYTHPSIIDQGDLIYLNKINRNNAYVSALSIGIGIRF